MSYVIFSNQDRLYFSKATTKFWHPSFKFPPQDNQGLLLQIEVICHTEIQVLNTLKRQLLLLEVTVINIDFVTLIHSLYTKNPTEILHNPDTLLINLY